MQHALQYALPEQEALEFISAADGASPWRPPLLFVHGSFCGAWVWRKHLMPYFARLGWSCHALSLRGHGASAGHENLPCWSIADYLADLDMAVERIGRPPVLIGHSMGGMLAQLYAATNPVPGLVLLAPVPVEGLGPCVYHMSLVAPDLLAQINLVQTFGSHLASPAIIHRAFFTAQTPHTEVMSHMQLMQPESHRAILELMNPWLRPGGCLADRVLVVGGTGDKMVPPDALRRTAAFYEAELVLDDVLPHGMMLDATWVRAALPLRRWLERLPA